MTYEYTTDSGKRGTEIFRLIDRERFGLLRNDADKWESSLGGSFRFWFIYANNSRLEVPLTVSLGDGNEWVCGSVKFDNFDNELTYYDYKLFDQWGHVRGFAEKQPKTAYKERINDWLSRSVMVAVKLMCDEQVAWLGRCRDLMVEWNAIAHEKWEFTGDTSKLTAENERLTADVRRLTEDVQRMESETRAPSVDELLMNTLVDKLQPAIQAKAQEMADAVMKDGSLPKVLKVNIADKTQKVEGVFNAVFEDVLLLCANDIPVFLTGDAGTGKNHLAEQVAEAMGLRFVYMGQVMDKYTDCVGFMDANGRTHETPLIQAVRNGGVLFIDEIDASIPEALITCNALLANGYMVTGWGERIDAHEDFHVLCAGNTVGTGADNVYTGRYALDGASLDRFAMVRVDYDLNVEIAMAGNDMDVVDFVAGFRYAVIAAGMHVPVSYRSIGRLAKLHKAGMDDKRILDVALLKSLSFEERKVIMRNLNDYQGNDIKNTWCYKAFKEIMD